MATPFTPFVRSADRGRFQKKEDPHFINERIKARTVRVVGEGIEQGVFSIEKALQIAVEAGLDLIEISPNAEPPVCKVADYKKFLYEQKKKQKELKAKAAKIVVKEIRFGPNTDEHDYNFKKNHALKFLQEGAKVKAFVFFRGRSILFKEQGEILLLRFAQELEEHGKVEQLPLLEGKRMIMIVSPKKNK
ncbi:MAG: translation initiation factor IF-3 [Bacteroidia bacterium]